MPQSRCYTWDVVVEVIKVSAALLLLYPVFNDLSVVEVFDRVVLEWNWFRVGVIPVVYVLSKKFFEHLEEPLWQRLIYAFYGAWIFTMIGWAGMGTHVEDADPLFGGGYEVIDFVPTDVERDLHGVAVFATVLVPALAGAYLARREAAGQLPEWLKSPRQ